MQSKDQKSSPRGFREEDPFRDELARKFASRSSSEILKEAAMELTLSDDESEEEEGTMELVDRETFF